MDSSSVFTKKNRKGSFSIKTILMKIVVLSVLIPTLLTIAAFFLSGEIESASLRQTRILYTGPEDLRTFIEQDNDFHVLSENTDQQKSMSDLQADITLEVYGDSASVYFSPEKISSVIAYERLSKLLAQYGEISAQGNSVAVYFESARQGIIQESDSEQFSLNHTVKFLFAAIASLLAFVILVPGNSKIINDRTSAFSDSNMSIVAQFISSAVFAFFTSAFVTASIFASSNYLIPSLLPDTVTNLTLITDIGVIFIFLWAGFILGLSADALKVCIHTLVKKININSIDFFIISSFFVLCAIFLSMFAVSGEMPDWSYFLPILNLLAVFKDAIMYGLEPGRLPLVIGINAVFCVICMTLSLKAEKSGYIIKKRNYYDNSR
jgi:hypothetical protein